MTHSIENNVPVAVVTGASRGLGLALTTALVQHGWRVVVDARDAVRLANALAGLPEDTVIRVPGDVADAEHRQRLAQAAEAAGGARLLVNNASVLGPSPQPKLADYPFDELRRVYAVNTVAPLMLTQQLLPQLQRHDGRIVNITSDAAVEPYEGWGGYGSSKAALDQLTAVLAAEQPELRVYAVDPGDMNTQMHQEAYPGEDISDRPDPSTVIPALLRLVDGALPSGRYRAAELGVEVPA
jgi:NAD(P)-dependent dehydrogenase (short-subunit alcohol dehydrogenase family)